MGLALAMAGAIAFSGKAIIVKLSYRHGVDAVTVIMYRMLFALPMFMVISWWASQRAHAKAHPLSRRDVLAIMGLGFLGYYLASFLDFLGLQTISAGLERLIIYLNPTLVMLLSALIYKHRLHRMRVWAMAISYALYLMFSGQMVQRIGALRLVGLASSVACVLAIGQFFLLRPLSSMAVPDEVLYLALLNATACTVAPVLLIMLAIERIGASLTAQIGMVGPMSTVSLGVLVLGEPLNAWIGLGTLLVLGGVYLASKHGEGNGLRDQR